MRAICRVIMALGHFRCIWLLEIAIYNNAQSAWLTSKGGDPATFFLATSSVI